MDFGLNRWNTYELTAPDGWEADLDAGGMEDEWMRRCGALGAYGVGDRDGLAIARLDWRWVARGRLGGPVHTELRVYLLGDEDGRFDLRLTEGERAALNADIRDWLVGTACLTRPAMSSGAIGCEPGPSQASAGPVGFRRHGAD